jgi:hypothetical protein
MTGQLHLLRLGEWPLWLLLFAVLWPVRGWSAGTCPAPDTAGAPLLFEYVSGQPGLPRSRVWCIEQDRAGFMWFGTENGLYKYDGYQATVFTADPAGGGRTLRSDDITDVHADRQGRLWVTTGGRAAPGRPADG